MHAIGPGLTLIEVQEQSDITYRLFDYGRGRELHLEHGFAVADLGPYTLGNDTRPAAEDGRTILTHCRYFTMEFRTLCGQVKFAPLAPHFHLVVVIKGRGHHRRTNPSCPAPSGACPPRPTHSRSRALTAASC